jgi:2,4-diaminopentanoate dehydrogenase
MIVTSDTQASATTKTKTRVIQWATGAVGLLTLKAIIQDPELELVGLLVYSEEKDGKDAGELAGTALTGVIATRDRDAITGIEADVVIHSPLAPTMEEMDDDVLALLASGKNVISTAGYFAPRVRGQDLVDRIEEACHTGNTSLHGGGIEPGFMYDRVAPMLTGMCLDITHIRVFETIDTSRHPAVRTLLDAHSLGQPPESVNDQTPFFRFFKAMFTETATVFGDQLGIEWDELITTVDVAVATKSFDIAVTRIEKGTIAGNRYMVKGIYGGRELLSMEIHWFAERDVAGWPMPAERYRWGVEIEGTPSLSTVMDVVPTLEHGDDGVYAFDPGFTGCAAACVNAISAVVAAPPGHFQPPLFAPWLPRPILK